MFFFFFCKRWGQFEAATECCELEKKGTEGGAKDRRQVK